RIASQVPSQSRRTPSGDDPPPEVAVPDDKIRQSTKRQSPYPFVTLLLRRSQDCERPESTSLADRHEMIPIPRVPLSEIASISDHAGPSGKAGREPEAIEITERREAIRIVHCKPNPRKGRYASGRSDSKTDRPATESGQATPLSQPNSSDNHSGQPVLERSSGSS